MKFTKDHEWAKTEGEKVIIGITDYAANQLGDVVFVELPAVGDNVGKGDTIGTIESVKTVSDLFAPVSGEIIAVNEELEGNPALVNEDPMGAGWILEVKPSNNAELDEMLDEEAYKKICE
jgi:glycine cleavage system H protein